jgi:hypothetical protein
MPSYPGSISSIPKWPSILAWADLSVLKYTEEDRVALKNYLEYVEMWQSRASSKKTKGA